MARRRFGRNYGRDPYRVHLKATAPHSDDARQLALDLSARPIASSSPWPAYQIDLEDYIAELETTDQC